MKDILTQAWEEREEKVYKSIFKNFPKEIITPEDPSKVVVGGVNLVHSCAGVYMIEPTENLPYWTYITSGLSNPFDELTGNDESISGYGIELVLQTLKKEYWPVNLLFNLMGYILETGKVLSWWHSMPCNGPIKADDSTCNITTILCVHPQHLPRTFELVTGGVDLIQIYGITDNEYSYCKINSSYNLINKLKKLPEYPAIVTTRSSIIDSIS